MIPDEETVQEAEDARPATSEETHITLSEKLDFSFWHRMSHAWIDRKNGVEIHTYNDGTHRYVSLSAEEMHALVAGYTRHAVWPKED